MKSFYYFYVYILQCIDGAYYVGNTDNLERRLVEHNNGLSDSYTARRLPVKLVWFESFNSRNEAFIVERRIKGWSHKKKAALIKGDGNAVKMYGKKRL